MESAAVALEMQEKNQQWCCGFFTVRRDYTDPFLLFFFLTIYTIQKAQMHEGCLTHTPFIQVISCFPGISTMCMTKRSVFAAKQKKKLFKGAF